MKKLAFFNHKGGVGKTTLTVNVADALVDSGLRVLLVDADPQCNLTSFYLTEANLEKLLTESSIGGTGGTLWSAVKPVVEGRGGVTVIPEWELIADSMALLPGDVLLSEYEEMLPEAWTECFARRTRGYDITTALSQVVDEAGARLQSDVCLYDVGPNVGALNRAVILDCDYLVTPVAADLFSLRALSTVGRSIAKWIVDWKTIRDIASPTDRARIFQGHPQYIGYVTSAFKVNAGKNAANPHADWEAKIAPRVRDRIIKVLDSVDPTLAPAFGGNKLGSVKHYHSLAPEGQRLGLAIGSLKGYVNSGHNAQISDAAKSFSDLGTEIRRRIGL